MDKEIEEMCSVWDLGGVLGVSFPCPIRGMLQLTGIAERRMREKWECELEARRNLSLLRDLYEGGFVCRDTSVHDR